MKLLPNNAYLITEKFEVSQIKPNNGKEFELWEVQRLVDGYIEVVRLNDRQIMIINEDGKFVKGYNQIATAIAHLHHAIHKNDYITGNAVICHSGMLK